MNHIHLPTTNENRPRPSRRWFRFSLRTLLVATTVLGFGFGMVAEWIKMMREREILGIFRNAGATTDGSDPKAQSPARTGSLVGDGCRLNDVRWVTLSFSHFSGHDVAKEGAIRHLKDLPNLESLAIRGGVIANADIKQISQLSKLKTLGFVDVSITDNHCPHLRKMTQLQFLDLWNTSVTSEEAEKLQQALPKCKIVWVKNN